MDRKIVTVKSYANIAIIKYWGKADAAKMIPATSSISLTLENMFTTTSVSFLPDTATHDEFYINGVLQDEKEHAKIWFKLLNGGKVPDTLTNLADAAAGEHEEWTEMYKEFAETAREEGFDDIADLFDAAGATEKAHEDRYNALTDKIKADKVFKKDEEIAWKCNNCGYIHYGKEAPEVCPLCDHPQAHFRKQDTSYI